MLRTIVKCISRVISYIIPQSKILLFFSYPNFTDNSYALYLHILSRPEYIKYKKIWILDYNEPDCDSKMQQIKKIDNKTIVAKMNSISSLWYYYRAEFFFFTHSLYSSFLLKDKSRRINLWHGMPLKNIGVLQHNSPATKTCSHLIIATSELFQGIMARAFQHPLDKVIISGQPRNDLFWDDTDFWEKYKIAPENYIKIGMWLPTYRTSLADDGSIVNEGSVVSYLSFLTYSEIEKLNLFLAERNILIIVKLHPMDILNEKQLPIFSNIRIYSKYDFTSQLYPLLGKMDFLLTDYSSVWVDFEILNKPIGFVMNDIDDYSTSRGFTIDNLIEKLPGTVINNFDKLEDFLINLPNGCHKNSIWNQYKDGQSSARVMNYLNSLTD